MVSEEQARQAVVTLLKWIGEDPNRAGLKDTPKRFIKSYKEFFAGYNEDPKKVLAKTFDTIADIKDPIILSGIDFVSFCEHHIVPIRGKVDVIYLPKKKVVGISKIARLVDIYAKRLQIQENLTIQIANTLDEVLKPKGVAVRIVATHSCMSCRGVKKQGVKMITSHSTGCFTNGERPDFAFNLIKEII